MQGMYLLCFVVTAAILVGSSQAIQCAGRADNPDSPNIVGCYYKTYCLNQTEVTETCTNGQVMERDSYSCLDPASANTACGRTPDPDCTGRADGSYADSSPCQTFYQCSNGQFVSNSRQYCAKPLVFDDDNGYCNWASNVPAPCGIA